MNDTLREANRKCTFKGKEWQLIANMLVVDIWSFPHTAGSELSRQFVKICTSVRKLQTNEVAVHVKKNQWSGKGARKVIDNRWTSQILTFLFISRHKVEYMRYYGTRTCSTKQWLKTMQWVVVQNVVLRQTIMLLW